MIWSTGRLARRLAAAERRAREWDDTVLLRDGKVSTTSKRINQSRRTASLKAQRSREQAGPLGQACPKMHASPSGHARPFLMALQMWCWERRSVSVRARRARRATAHLRASPHLLNLLDIQLVAVLVATARDVAVAEEVEAVARRRILARHGFRLVDDGNGFGGGLRGTGAAEPCMPSQAREYRARNHPRTLDE